VQNRDALTSVVEGYCRNEAAVRARHCWPDASCTVGMTTHAWADVLAVSPTRSPAGGNTSTDSTSLRVSSAPAAITPATRLACEISR